MFTKWDPPMRSTTLSKEGTLLDDLDGEGTMHDETATTLHPCWEAYRLIDKYACGYLISWF